jgi:hypothetical protein
LDLLVPVENFDLAVGFVVGRSAQLRGVVLALDRRAPRKADVAEFAVVRKIHAAAEAGLKITYSLEDDTEKGGRWRIGDEGGRLQWERLLEVQAIFKDNRHAKDFDESERSVRFKRPKFESIALSGGHLTQFAEVLQSEGRHRRCLGKKQNV